MIRFIKISVVVIVVALVIIGASVVFVNAGIETPINPLGETLTAGMANAVIDAADIKSKAEGAIKSNAQAISIATGLPVSEVDKMIADLGITDWTVIPLPDGAQALETTSFRYDGALYEITTYTDPSIVTIATGSTSATFSIPDSASPYLKYLSMM